MTKAVNDRSRLANRIRELRQGQGWTLKQLAARIGKRMHASNLAAIETGERQLSDYWAERIADVFSIAVADLHTREQGGLEPRERELIDTYRALSPVLRVGFDTLGEAYRRQLGIEGSLADLRVRRTCDGETVAQPKPKAS